VQQTRARHPAARTRLKLDDDQRAWLEAARERVDEDALAETLARLVDVPSPTGAEAVVAAVAADELRAARLEAETQALHEGSANAVGLLRGSGDGATLLLYGHLDTHLTGDDALDAPAADGPVPELSRPRARRDGETLYGLGAGNPKGFAACMVAVARAAAAVGGLRGSLVVGLAAGGMPVRGGDGAGALALLEHIQRPDFAVIGKPGWAVAWEEVGVCIFRLRVRGELGYAGTRHILRYDNPIAGAARLVLALEEWAERFAADNESGLVRPQAVVGALDAGWTSKPTFVPAWADVWVDVRVSPRSDANEVEGQLREAIAASGVEAQIERVVALPGTHTDPDSWIVRSSVRAWEDAEGRAHEPIAQTSGATDAAILRSSGLPTARFGMPSSVRELTPTLELDLDSIHLPSAVRYVRTLLYVVADTCLRTRNELGLG
jgi:acetylornithine deacetylase/succinyl-diaminopimelate desuccinylase-like protein